MWRRTLLLPTISLLLLSAPLPADAKKRKGKAGSKPGQTKTHNINVGSDGTIPGLKAEPIGVPPEVHEKSESRPFTQKHPQQPKFEQIREEDIPPGTPIKKIREGEVLDLAENAKKESERKFPKEVENMFDAVMTDDFASLNKVLKDEKVPVDVRGPNGYTPLFQAVFSHKINSVHMLLEAGADPRLRNNQGFNALDAGAYGGCVQCVHMLLKHPKVNPFLIGRDGYSALHRAIWGDDPEHTETVEILLEAGLSPTKPAVVPGQGTLAPIDMVNENMDTLRLLKRAIKREEKKAADKKETETARAAEAAKAEAVFGAVGKKATKDEAKKDEL